MNKSAIFFYLIMHFCFGINGIKFYKAKLLTFLMVVAKLDTIIGGSEPEENSTAFGVDQ